MTGQCHLHLFAVKQPDHTWENPEVREAVYSMMNWWLDRSVDSFRRDVINFTAKVQADLDHGQPRSVSRFGDDGQFRFESATLFATILPLHRGWPYRYQGDEIGMTNAGFTTGTSWPAITPNHATINMATDLASGSRSIFEFYRRLIAPRHGSSVVSLGDFVMLEPEHPARHAFTRSLGGETLVVGNFSSEPLELPLAVAGDLVIGNLVIGNWGEVADVAGAARPWEVRAVRPGRVLARMGSRRTQNYFCTTSDPAMRWAT